MTGFHFLSALIPCAVVLFSGCADGFRYSVRGVPAPYQRPGVFAYNNVAYRPATQIAYYPQTVPAVQTQALAYTMTSAQCDSKWTTALLAEMMNYDNWKCSSRVMPDTTTVSCVITGPLTTTSATSPYYLNTGCGWMLPFFCDDSVRDLVTSMVGTQQAAAQTPPLGYTLIPGVGYYKVHPELLTWNQSRMSCEAEGAHLATPSSVNDYNSLFSYLNSVLTTQTGVWIGFTDQAVEGEFRTVSNQPACMLGQLPFGNAQPDGSTSENCLQFGSSLTPSLNDLNCITPLPFICEQTLSTRLAVCKTVVNSG